MALLLIIIIVFGTMVYCFTNGFHDTANAIATSVSTRALSPRLAVAMAATANLLGALYSTAVAQTVGKGIVDVADGVSLELVLCAIIGAVAWNLLTWYYGIPSSSTHALIGGLVGAGVAEGGMSMVHWDKLVTKVAIPMVSSPAMGFVAGYLLMLALLWLVKNRAPAGVNRWFRIFQIGSAAFMAISHGRNDAQNAMGILTLALLSYGSIEQFSVPLWVMFASAGSMAVGTYFGGWRIIHTLGTKVIKLDPIHGFAAETSAAASIQIASTMGAPVSTTQTITAAIMGVGSTQRLSAVRWGVAGDIVTAWVLTLPASGCVAAIFYEVLRLV